MRRHLSTYLVPVLAFVFCFTVSAPVSAQIKRTETPLGEILAKALTWSSLIGEGAQPFHLRVIVSEPENPQSPYQGTIEEWWLSPTKWRREITSKDGMHQTIVDSNGTETERDEGEYFPLLLRSFVPALRSSSMGITIQRHLHH